MQVAFQNEFAIQVLWR